MIFPNATIAAMLSTDARIAPTRFQAFAILAVCRSIRFVTCAVLACTFFHLLLVWLRVCLNDDLKLFKGNSTTVRYPHRLSVPYF